MKDVDEEYEKERQRRMYNMLRHSNHYKRIQVGHSNVGTNRKFYLVWHRRFNKNKFKHS